MLSSILGFITLGVGVIQAVFQLVKLFEVPGFGPEKKKAVLAVLRLIWPKLKESIKEIDVPWETFSGVAGQVIDLVVDFFNLTGVFSKSGPEEVGK